MQARLFGVRHQVHPAVGDLEVFDHRAVEIVDPFVDRPAHQVVVDVAAQPVGVGHPFVGAGGDHQPMLVLLRVLPRLAALVGEEGEARLRPRRRCGRCSIQRP